MIRTVKLENYLPLYIQEYREMWKLMQAENPEFQLANNETEKIKNNLFIDIALRSVFSGLLGRDYS